jgi:hypothetical protein
VTEVSGVTDHVAAVALAYCTDQPLKLIVELPELKISIKSFRKGAPEFPPPPKTWLITICGDESGVGVGDGLGVGVGVGVDVGVGVGVGVGVAPARINETGLLCTPSAVAMIVDVPAPRRSAGTRT